MERKKDKNIIQKIVRKPTAALALGFIILVFLIAIFAYAIAPDGSPNANRMIVELGAKKPGFTKKILLIPNQQIIITDENNFSWWSGKSDEFQYLPINQYWFEGDKIVVSHFIDDGLQDTLKYSISAIVPVAISKQNTASQKIFLEQNNITNHTFYLGSDRYGRDILSRLFIGARVSIAVGFVAVILSLFIGVLLGAMAGYFGGLVDNAIMFVINIFWSIPTLLLVFALTLSLGKGFWEIFIAIGLTMWVGAARLVRGQVMALREMDYVSAVKAIGASHSRIILKHILPNISGSIIVIAANNFAAAILIEAGLSFLGIGIQPPQPSWGLMIKEHYNFIITNQPMAAIIPGLAIMLLVYSFNVLGNTLRDILDVKNE